MWWAGCGRRRCSKGVDPVLECAPKLVAIDEEADHQIVHRRCFGKTNRPAYKTFDPSPQVDVFTLDSLRVLLTHVMLRWVDIPLVRPPSIGVKPRDPKRLQQALEFEKDGILPPPKDVR